MSMELFLFWSSGNFNTQNACICGCVKLLQVKGNSSRKSGSRSYYVNNDSGISTKICRTAFIHIHGVAGGRIDRALKSIAATGGSPHMDLRGCHEPGNKTEADQLTFVKNHICSFPQYGSHYSQSDNPHRKYLSPGTCRFQRCTLCIRKYVERRKWNQ